MRSAQFDKKGGIDKELLNADVLDCFIMACWDLKEFDYTHTDIIKGNIDNKKKTGKKSVFIEREEFS